MYLSDQLYILDNLIQNLVLQIPYRLFGYSLRNISEDSLVLGEPDRLENQGSRFQFQMSSMDFKS